MSIDAVHVIDPKSYRESTGSEPLETGRRFAPGSDRSPLGKRGGGRVLIVHALLVEPPTQFERCRAASINKTIFRINAAEGSVSIHVHPAVTPKRKLD